MLSGSSFYFVSVATLSLSCLFLAALARQLQTVSLLGCFVDNTANRDVKGLKDLGFKRLGDAVVSQSTGQIFSSLMTHELCIGVCSLGAFKYAALQAMYWCNCGNSFNSYGPAPNGVSECSQTCGGNSNQNCGFNYRNYILRLNYKYTYTDSLFVLGNRTFVGISKTDAPAFQTVRALGLIDCTIRCDVNCQAVIFNQQTGLCHLLEYPVVPDALGSLDSGDFYVRA